MQIFKQFCAPGPRPAGVASGRVGTVAETMATGHQVADAQRLWKRYHDTADERRQQRAKRPTATRLPNPEDVRRWARRFSKA